MAVAESTTSASPRASRWTWLASRTHRDKREHRANAVARAKVAGHFWQGRFGALATDEAHLAAATRYVAQNPVRARLVDRAWDWPWSSVRGHLSGRADDVTTLAPIRDRFPRFADVLDRELEAELVAALRAAETIGRPLGDPRFVRALETITRRRLHPQERGPKLKAANTAGKRIM
jgi:putative transposase